MLNVNKFKSRYSDILEIIQEAGFVQPTLVRGFCEEDQQQFNFIVNDNYIEENKGSTKLKRLHSVMESLSSLLENKITIVLFAEVKPRYLKKTNLQNSVKLTHDLDLNQIERILYPEHSYTFFPLVEKVSERTKNSNQSVDEVEVVLADMSRSLVALIKSSNASIGIDALFNRLQSKVKEQLQEVQSPSLA